MTARMVEIGSFLTPVKRDEPVDRRAIYPMMGVRSFGRGPFAAAPLSGDATSYSTLRKVDAGDVVYPKLMAWEGAFALVPSELAGRWVSPEFCVFEVDESVADHRYVSHLLAWEGLRDRLVGRSSGTNARRRRLQPTAFLAHRVPLPELLEQHRIANYLDHIHTLCMRLPLTFESANSALDWAEHQFLESFSQVRPIGEVVTVNPRPSSVDAETPIVFVSMDAVDQYDGRISSPKIRLRSDLVSGYKQFQPGDVIFARITPCMQNGKCAVYADPAGRPAYGSTEFHVLRSENPADCEWIHAVLRTRWFRDRAMASFTGTAGQQRVPANFLRTAAIPFPAEGVRHQALQRLRQADATRQHLREASSRRSQLASSLQPAARNEVFSALR